METSNWLNKQAMTMFLVISVVSNGPCCPGNKLKKYMFFSTELWIYITDKKKTKIVNLEM